MHESAKLLWSGSTSKFANRFEFLLMDPAMGYRPGPATFGPFPLYLLQSTSPNFDLALRAKLAIGPKTRVKLSLARIRVPAGVVRRCKRPRHESHLQLSHAGQLMVRHKFRVGGCASHAHLLREGENIPDGTLVSNSGLFRIQNKVR